MSVELDLMKRVRELEAELEAQSGEPIWTCAACGAGHDFRTIKYDTPGEPIEYDIECMACGSLDIRESAEEAAKVLGERLESAGIEMDELRAGVAMLEEAVKSEREACAMAVLDSGWHNDECPSSHGHPPYACDCEPAKIAAAIRARGHKP